MTHEAVPVTIPALKQKISYKVIRSAIALTTKHILQSNLNRNHSQHKLTLAKPLELHGKRK